MKYKRMTQLYTQSFKIKYPESPINAWNFGFNCFHKTVPQQ